MKNAEKTKRLPNSFFRRNPLEHMSAAMIAHYVTTGGMGEAFEHLVDDLTEEVIDDARKAKIQQERQRIEETEDPGVLVEIMRKGYDIANQKLLCEKILQDQEHAMPLVLKRYRTSALDQFIDAATIVLGTGEKKYVQMLRDMYADIRDPFAQACACLVIGIQGMEEEIPFLLQEYERFRQGYPDESFEQHPLLALYLLHGKY